MKLSQMKPSKRIIAASKKPSTTRLLVNLQQLRENRGVTLRQVEKEIKVSNATLCQIEHGCTPSLETALKIAAFIEIPVERIWTLK